MEAGNLNPPLAPDPDAWQQVCWRLRSEVVVHPQWRQGRRCYVLEDPIRSKFYQLGPAEYALVAQLDGERTVEQALSAVPELAASQVQRIVSWLVQSQLVQTAGAAHADRLQGLADQAAHRKRWSRWNPLSIQIPLIRPERLLQRLMPVAGWLLTRRAAIGALLFGLAALAAVASQSVRLRAASSEIFAAENLLLLGGCLLLLKLVHELGHGLACRRFGGEVREAGVTLLYFFPLAYIDLTSAWRFRSKWDRIVTAGAGIYFELWVASLAALVWAVCDSGPLAHVLFHLMLASSLTTLLFNANPLMRFDGYYMLSDWLEIPNLYARGQQAVDALVRKLAWGLPFPRSADGPWVGRTIVVYGLAAFVWRIVVLLGVSWMLCHQLLAVGVALSVVLWAGWLVPLTRRLAAGCSRFRTARPGQRVRFVAVCSMVLVAVAAGLGVPFAWSNLAPAIVCYSPQTVVRAPTAGFVRELHVAAGQQVRAGDLLVTLDNPSLATDLARLELELDQAALRVRMYRSEGQAAPLQAAEEERRSLAERLAEKRDEWERLQIVAETSGQVVRRDLEQLLGTFLHRGDEVLTLGNEQRKELRIALSQQHVDRLATFAGTAVTARIAGHDRIRTSLKRVQPQASRMPLAASLCAPYGGPLPVTSAPDEQQDAALRLLEPHFTAIATLAPDVGRRLRTGQRAQVTLQGAAVPLASHLWQACREWWYGKE